MQQHACLSAGGTDFCTEQWELQTSAVNMVLESEQEKHLCSISVRNNARPP